MSAPVAPPRRLRLARLWVREWRVVWVEEARIVRSRPFVVNGSLPLRG